MYRITEQHPTSGFNLVEAAVVLGVAGLVIGGIWVAASSVQENLRVSRTIEMIFTIARNAQNLINISQSTSIGNNSITATLVSSGGIPSNFVDTSSNPKNAFGGGIGVYNWADAGNNRFDIYNHNVPKSSCINLLVRLSALAAMAGGTGTSSYSRAGLGYIAVYDTSTSGTNTLATTTFPISLATATTACASTNNVIVTTFGYTH